MAKNITDFISPDHASLIALRMAHGWTGYGIYCAIINLLERQPGGAFRQDYGLIAFHLSADEGIVRSVVEDFSLFSFDQTDAGETLFYFPAIREKAARQAEISRRRAEAASKRWGGDEKSAEKKTPKDSISERRYADPVPQINPAPAVPREMSQPQNNNRPQSFETATQEYDLIKNPEVLTGDKIWMDQVAEKRHCSHEILLKLFVLFLNNQKANGGGRYKEVREAKMHFFNWLAKDYALNRKAELIREEMNERRKREYDEQQARSVTYDEYCRIKAAREAAQQSMQQAAS
ncbi:MAG: hypothetical protein K2N05_04875 [Muribaculaceae bacterium]|nr:hypothetical protein [Muribaculaceae bacterium]